MKIVIAQGSPVVPSRALDSITDAAEFFLQVNIGLHYVRGSASNVIAKKHGRVVFSTSIPAPFVPAFGIVRFFMLPLVHRHYVRVILEALKRSPESTESIFVARSWLPCIAGLLARRRGLVRQVVYWVNDYYPPSDSAGMDRLFNAVFRRLDKFVVARADEVWYLTSRLHAAHAAPDGSRLTSAPEKVVPCLYDSHPEVYGMWDKKDLHRFVYVGLVKIGQGLDIILPAIVEAGNSLPGIRLDVIGDGPHLEHFRKTAGNLCLQDSVVFHGRVEDEARMHELIASAAAAFALYDLGAMPHASYTLNSKVYAYIGCGIPVLITRGAGSHDFVVSNGAGIGVEYNVQSLVEGMTALCGNPDTYPPRRMASQRLACNFSRDKDILLAALESCFAKAAGKEYSGHPLGKSPSTSSPAACRESCS